MHNEYIFKLIAKKFAEETTEEENIKIEQWCNENTQNKKLYDKLQSMIYQLKQLEIKCVRT